MNNQQPNSTKKNSPSGLGRREFAIASAGLITAAGVAAHAQTGATAAPAEAAGSHNES